MILSRVGSLTVAPLTGRWFRAFQPRFLPTALSTIHTRSVMSRFSPGPHGIPPFDILYLAENQQVALFEVGALYGSPLTPGGLVPHPRSTWTIANVKVKLQSVADLTQVSEQTIIGTTAQELTGDWQGYRSRSLSTSVSGPVGVAPTQELGQALAARPIEAFLSLSARLPYHQTLMIFPNNLTSGSRVTIEYDVGAGVQTLSIP